MKYALLVYSKPGSHESLGEVEREQATSEYMALANDSRVASSAQLQPIETATTVRVQNGRTPPTAFADTKEVFGGYYVLDAANIDEAIDAASRIPAARMEGSIEVRPVVEH
jgi:hypothetical protein